MKPQSHPCALPFPEVWLLFPQQTCQASVRKDTLNCGGFFIFNKDEER
jgi:hypothetical protein